jgi:hypothetical protein
MPSSEHAIAKLPKQILKNRAMEPPFIAKIIIEQRPIRVGREGDAISARTS